MTGPAGKQVLRHWVTADEELGRIIGQQLAGILQPQLAEISRKADQILAAVAEVNAKVTRLEGRGAGRQEEGSR